MKEFWASIIMYPILMALAIFTAGLEEVFGLKKVTDRTRQELDHDRWMFLDTVPVGKREELDPW